MHILLIHQAFAALNEPGGTRHHELARHLAARGHHITVIASPVSYLTGSAPGGRIPWMTRENDGERITVLRAYTYPALHRSFIHRVFSFLSFMLSSLLIGFRVREVDLVWGTSPPIFQGATAWALARLKRTPLLFEVRDLWPAFAVAVGVLRQPALIWASEWLERFLYRQADQVMINSPGFQAHVLAQGAQSVALIPNGADIAMFDPQADGTPFRQEHELENKFVALYAGAHGMSNDLDVLLAAADLLRNRPEIVLVLLGAGKEKGRLMARAAALSLPNIHFLAPIPKTAMHQALAAADACIAILKPIPLYATVYPNKVFDYMAAGRPVVLAIDGVIREVVEAAEAGIFVPPGDPGALAAALETLAADQSKRRRLGMNGRHYLEAHFDRAALADQLAALVESLVQRRRR
jgi:glycosyltransferase involved in cell wall biosynthesis